MHCKSTLFTIVAVILMFVLPLAASASENGVESVAQPLVLGSSGAAFGLSLFVGPPSADPFQVVSGYDGGTIYTATRGGAIRPTNDAIVLRRNGTYRVHLEGVLALDADDATGDPDGGATFTLLINDVPWVSCATPNRSSASILAADWQFTPDHELVASCTVDFTIEVRSRGSDPGTFPLVFARDTEIKAALIPNDRALGDATLYLTRFEISRSAP